MHKPHLRLVEVQLNNMNNYEPNLQAQELLVSWKKFCEKQEVNPFYCRLPEEWAKFTSSASPYPYPIRPLSNITSGVTSTGTTTTNITTSSSTTLTTTTL